MCGKSRPSSKQMLVPLMCWPPDRCCVGAAVCSELKGLADKQKPLNLRAEGRGEGRQKGGGGLQRLKTASLSKGGPRKAITLILLFVSFERGAWSPWQLSTSHAWRPRRQEVTGGWRKWLDLGVTQPLWRCLRYLPGCQHGGGGQHQNHWNNWHFYHSFKGIRVMRGFRWL